MSLSLLRLAILVYASVLISSAWPFPTTPLLGPLGSTTRAMLAEISIEPGERVFPGSANEMGAIADCITVEGSEGFGNWRELYRSDCPPTTHHDALHQLHRYSVRHGSLDSLLIRHRELPEAPDEIFRRFTALGDFYCHSDLVEGPARSRVRLGLVQTARHLRTGEIVKRELDCIWRCAEESLAIPRCRRGDPELIGPSRTGDTAW